MSKYRETQRFVESLNTSLAESISDMEDMQQNNRIFLCNVDYSIYHSFLHGAYERNPSLAERIYDNILRTYKSMDENGSVQFIMTRATVFEMLNQILSEIDRLETRYLNQPSLDDYRSNIRAFIQKEMILNTVEASNELMRLHAMLPKSGLSRNIHTLSNMFRSDKIKSYYEVFGKQEVVELRPDITRLAKHIEDREYHRNYYTGKKPESEKINTVADCRNMSTSVHITKHARINHNEKFFAPYYGPRHSVQNYEFREVHRTRLGLACLIHAMSSNDTINEAIKANLFLLGEANLWHKIFERQKHQTLAPQLVKEAEAFIQENIPLAKQINNNPLSNYRTMKNNLEKAQDKNKAIEDELEKNISAIEESGRALLKQSPIDLDFLDDHGLNDNKRAMEVIKRFS